VSHDETGFAEFFKASWDPCVRAVAASTGDMLLAEDQVAEAFARAKAPWRKVSRYPAPRAWVVRTVAGAAAGTALALGLTGILGSAPAHGTATIRTAAFTIVSNPNGTTTLTINPSELLDPATLQSDLVQDGILAMITVDSFCSSDSAQAGFPQVVSFQSAGELTVTPQSGMHPAITIDPAAMPAGTEVGFGDFQLTTGEQQASFALIDASSYACTSTPPGPAGPSDGAQLLYGGHTAS
jgi:hypothetical protein